MNRFRENFQNLDFWPKKVPFLPCISEITIFPRKGLPHFFVFIVSESHAKKKSEELPCPEKTEL